MDITVTAIIASMLAGFVVLMVRAHRRKARRRQTLRHDANTGTFIWTDFDGTERRSDRHPEEPGGAWYTEGADGPGDSGGGDGGGGGD